MLASSPEGLVRFDVDRLGDRGEDEDIDRSAGGPLGTRKYAGPQGVSGELL